MRRKRRTIPGERRSIGGDGSAEAAGAPAPGRCRNPSLTVDGIVMLDDNLVLVRRRNPPFQGMLALPGGFVEYGETTEEAVAREVKEETGLSTTVKRLLGVYSDRERDPRGHTVTVVYVLETASRGPKPGTDAASVELLDPSDLPRLAFDHSLIVRDFLRSEDPSRTRNGKKHN